MDLQPFIKRIARGRDLYDCGREIQAELARKIVTSPIFFIRNFLQTVDKDGELVLQDPWLGQALLDVCCESQRKRQLPQQVIEVKARKVGFTQHNISRGFWASMRPNNDTLVLVQDEDVATDFMKRVGTFYNQLPSWLRPMKRIDNAKLLNFDNPRAELRADNPGLNSSFNCTVPSGIRGNAPKYFIWSEAAFTKNWEEVVDAVLNGMGASVSYCQILDSTPNGEDDFYFPLVMEAIERNPKWVKSWERKGAPTREEVIQGILGEPDAPEDGWVPAFMPWHWHEEFCVVKGTRISTARGLLDITDVRLGEKTDYGKVSKLWNFKNKPTIKVTLETGREIVCTYNHPLMTNEGWVKAGDINLGDALKVKRPEFGRTIQILDHVEISPRIGRFLGYYMADGSFDPRKGTLNFACHSEDIDIIDDIRELCNEFDSNFEPSARIWTRKSAGLQPNKKSKCIVVRITRKSFIEFFFKNGLACPNLMKRIVHVPDCIFRSPTNVIKEFLSGVFEGDGYADQRGMAILLGSKHKKFVQEIQLLLHMFGIRSAIYKRVARIGSKTHEGWNLHLRASECDIFNKRIGFISNRKRGRVEKKGYAKPKMHQRKIWPDYEKVVGIEDAGVQDVYDVTVPGSHAFVANGIIVHNTTKDESPIGQLPPLNERQIQHLKATLGKVEKYGGEEETDLMKRFGVSTYRLAWRRWKIDNHTAGRDWYERILTFRQENLSDYRSGFVKLGRSTFDIRGMEILGRQVCDPPIRGKIRRHPETNELYVDMHYHSDWENLRIWATPDPQEDYVVGVDGSNAWYSNDGDSWVAQVLRRRDRKQVAVHEMRCPPDVVRDNLRMLYDFYHRPLLGIEMEGQAVAVAHALFKLGVTRQYRWKRFDTDPYKEPGTDYIGWETSSKSRGIMQGALVEAIGARDESDNPVPTIILRDQKTFDELGSCTRDDYGKIANHGGGHDDHVLALMIALAIDLDHWEPQHKPRKPKDDRPDNPLLERYTRNQPTGRNRPAYETL